jgi:hypothetical protein
VRSRRRFSAKRIAVIVSSFVFFLIAVNQISISVAPCNYLANTERENHEKNNAANYKCSTKDGIIIQGIFLLPEIRPEWWGAISSCLIFGVHLTRIAAPIQQV